MSDNSSRKTPPFGSKRPVSSGAGNLPRASSEGAASRSPQGRTGREFEAEEITDQYEGEDLELHRSMRPTNVRIDRLEKKADAMKLDQEIMKRDLADARTELGGVRSDMKALSKDMSDTRSDVARAAGKIDGQESVLTEMLSIVRKGAERDHVTFTAKVEVDKEKELAKVEVDKEKELAKVEVDKETKVDAVKAKADRRKRNLTILGAIASGGTLIELLHRLGGC